MVEQPPKVELEQEADGRWLAEVINLPGALAYVATRDEAVAKAAARYRPTVSNTGNECQS